MSLIPAATLNALRTANEGLMPLTATIFSRTAAVDGYGGTTETAIVRATVKARLIFIGNQPSYQDAIQGAKIQPDEAYLVALPYGTAVTESGRAVVYAMELAAFNALDEEDQDAADCVTYAIVTQIGSRSFQSGERFLVRRLQAGNFSL